MSIKKARHYLLYFKDLFQGTIYAALSNSRLFTVLTPMLALVVRPLLGFTLSTLAILQAWSFFHAAHKNIDGWTGTVSSLSSALFNNIAAFGGFLARIQGTIFTLAPWFFVTGFSIGALNQLFLAGLNARRAYEVWAHREQRQHYIQAAIFNLVIATQLASCVTAIILFNLFPANTLLITGFALTVVGINVGSCAWRFISSDAKKEIKETLGIGKTKENNKEEYLVTSSIGARETEELSRHTRLFTSCNYSAIIRNMCDVESKSYLLSIISQKLLRLANNPNTEKNQQKINVLMLLEKTLIEDKLLLDAGKLHHQYPRLVDNFWCEKSDTQQLLEAVVYYCRQHRIAHSERTNSSFCIK